MGMQVVYDLFTDPAELATLVIVDDDRGGVGELRATDGIIRCGV